MTIVVTGHSSSLEGFIACADDSSERPWAWAATASSTGSATATRRAGSPPTSRGRPRMRRSSTNTLAGSERSSRGAESTTSATGGAGAERYAVTDRSARAIPRQHPCSCMHRCLFTVVLVNSVQGSAGLRPSHRRQWGPRPACPFHAHRFLSGCFLILGLVGGPARH